MLKSLSLKLAILLWSTCDPVAATRATHTPPRPPEHLISDYDFTNQDFTYVRILFFVNSFSNNRLTEGEVKWIVSRCRYYGVNAWVVLVQLQKESSLIGNLARLDYDVRKGRAMGYSCATVGTNAKGYNIGKYHDFYLQVDLGIRTLRKWFDHYTNVRGRPIMVYSSEKKIVPQNAATYSLYKYTPFYGKAFIYGRTSVGNLHFIRIWREYMERRKRVLARCVA